MYVHSTKHTHAQTHTYTRTPAHTHSHTHAHTHKKELKHKREFKHRQELKHKSTDQMIKTGNMREHTTTNCNTLHTLQHTATRRNLVHGKIARVNKVSRNWCTTACVNDLCAVTHDKICPFFLGVCVCACVCACACARARAYACPSIFFGSTKQQKIKSVHLFLGSKELINQIDKATQLILSTATQLICQQKK